MIDLIIAYPGSALAFGVVLIIATTVVAVEIAVGRRLGGHLKQIKGMFRDALMLAQGFEGATSVLSRDSNRHAEQIATLVAVQGQHETQLQDHESRLRILEVVGSLPPAPVRPEP